MSIKSLVNFILFIHWFVIVSISGVWFFFYRDQLTFEVQQVVLLSSSAILVIALASAIMIRQYVIERIEVLKKNVTSLEKKSSSSCGTKEKSCNEVEALGESVNNVVDYAKKRSKELEKWRTISMERELKLIKLKREIKELRQKVSKDELLSLPQIDNETEDEKALDASTENIVDRMKTQHNELISLFESISKLDVIENSKIIHSKLMKCRKLLMKHLTLEDEIFYPQFLEKMKKGNIDMQKILSFIAEMVAITDSVNLFFDKYSSHEYITKNSSRFKKDFLEMVNTLSMRIDAEEDSVYMYWNLINIT